MLKTMFDKHNFLSMLTLKTESWNGGMLKDLSPLKKAKRESWFATALQ